MGSTKGRVPLRPKDSWTRRSLSLRSNVSGNCAIGSAEGRVFHLVLGDSWTRRSLSLRNVALPKTPDVKRPAGPTSLKEPRAALNNHPNNSKERKSRHELEKSIRPIVTCLS